MSAAAELAESPRAELAPIGIPVRDGRLTLGRLTYRSRTGIDRRGRVMLDYRARTWLAVEDPNRFEAVAEPLVVLADEPTGNLDSTATVDVLRLFESLYETRQTLVIVTHDERIAATTDRLISMRDGAFVDETRLTRGTRGTLGALAGLEG